LRVVGLGPHVGPTPPDTLSPDQIAELWLDPGDMATLDLFNGPWGSVATPDPNETFAFIAQKTSGFSPGYDVKDSAGTEWGVKMGPEAQTEVVASRIVSAMGTTSLRCTTCRRGVRGRALHPASEGRPHRVRISRSRTRAGAPDLAEGSSVDIRAARAALLRPMARGFSRSWLRQRRGRSLYRGHPGQDSRRKRAVADR
jgi:hypothetical protein